MANYLCEPFQNTTIHASARRIGRGPLAGAYRGYIRTVERSAWLTPCRNTYASAIARPTRELALADADAAAQEAARTGYVPAF